MSDAEHEHDHELDAQIDREMGWDKIPGRRKPAVQAGYQKAFVRSCGKIVGGIWWVIKSIVRLFFFILFFPIFTPLRVLRKNIANGVEVVSKRSIASRLFEGIVVRALIFTLIVVGYFLLLVYLTTRPTPVMAMGSPAGQGLFYRSVDLASSDGQIIRAWYVPAVSADDVVLDQSQSFVERWPAVVLAHGLGYSHDQYLNLARRLNGLGFAVLLLDTRGQGSSPQATVTFGLRERNDLLAAVAFLRMQRTTDPAKICVVGQGMNATAALRAAQFDPSIAAVIADSADPDFSAKVETFSPGPKSVARAVALFYRNAFDLTLKEKIDDLALAPTLASIVRVHLLFVARPDDDNGTNNALWLTDHAGAKAKMLLAKLAKDNGSLQPEDEREQAKFLCEACAWTPPVMRRQQAIRTLLGHQLE